MISTEVRERVLRLRTQGYGIRWLASHLGLSRNSVRRILRPPELEGAPAEPSAPRRASLLKPFRARVREILEEEARQREKKPGLKPLTTKRILKELRKLGYAGSRSILDEFVREVRGPTRRGRKPSVRFETAPAEEAQQDWSTYRVLVAGKQIVIQLFSMILCWSRYQ
ncbi:MAG: hypothetical protein JW820_18170, partial [Spirochaetales bacterium]|nr:hypothetical protein [Spirochaetales bacterium]